jgi:NTP pyrophosphatase (non-canonical NTP hydrolase)
MDMNEYQKQATKTVRMPEGKEDDGQYALMYFCMGLAGETGEVIEKVKKVMRNYNGELSEEKRALIKHEIGDVLWYLSQTARMCDILLDDAASANIEKLQDRAARGVIKSEGDTR